MQNYRKTRGISESPSIAKEEKSLGIFNAHELYKTLYIKIVPSLVNAFNLIVNIYIFSMYQRDLLAKYDVCVGDCSRIWTYLSGNRRWV
jgi:hypothetical protein